MVEWIYKGKVITDKPPKEGTWGFVYMITYTNNKKYIGKKQMWSVTKKPFGKKMLATVTDQRAKKYEMVTKENAWRRYVGSSKDTKGLTILKKEILELCSDKINLTYCEIKHLVKNDVLTNDEYLNSNILGKFYFPKIKG